jgi:hypothetical protein
MLPDGGMGALGGALWPGQNVAWPAVELKHPVYRHDVNITYRRNQEPPEHHHTAADSILAAKAHHP